jgi:hypothetical protein
MFSFSYLDTTWRSHRSAISPSFTMRVDVKDLATSKDVFFRLDRETKLLEIFKADIMVLIQWDLEFKRARSPL